MLQVRQAVFREYAGRDGPASGFFRKRTSALFSIHYVSEPVTIWSCSASDLTCTLVLYLTLCTICFHTCNHLVTTHTSTSPHHLQAHSHPHPCPRPRPPPHLPHAADIWHAHTEYNSLPASQFALPSIDTITSNRTYVQPRTAEAN